MLAKVLQLRGVDVKVLLCDSELDGCEIKSVRAPCNPCLECQLNRKLVLSHLDLPVVSIKSFLDEEEINDIKNKASNICKDYPEQYYQYDINLIPIVDDSVVRFYYGNVPVNKDKLYSVRSNNLATALISTVVAGKIHKEWSPSLVLSNMQAYSQWAPFYKYFNNNDVPYISINYTALNYNSVRYNLVEYYQSSNRFDRYVASRKNSKLTQLERKDIGEYLDNRFSGNISMFKDGEWYANNRQLTYELLVDPNKRNVFLAANVFWDKGINEMPGLFGNVLDWVMNTIQIVEKSPECHLYIKIHPAEKYFYSKTEKGVADYILEKYKQLPGNVTLIYPEKKISPYKLIKHADVGVVFSGTLGLEMMLNNLPVIVTGSAPYKHLNFCAEPGSLDEYESFITGKLEIPMPDQNKLELFSYFHFLRTPIPWTLTKQSFIDKFDGYAFDSLDDVMPGKDRYLDHLCNCIMDKKNNVPEMW